MKIGFLWAALRVLALGVAVALGAAAHAHTKSESYAIYEIHGSTVDLTYSVTESEAVRLAPAIDGAQPAHGAPGAPRHLTDEELGGYLNQHLSVTSGEPGHEIPAVLAAPARALTASAGFRRFEFVFKAASAQAIALHSSVFFDLVPSHVSFARIRTDNGEYIEQLFTTDHRDLALGGESPLQNASFWKYIGLGILHILTGPDHIAFLIGLLLISRSFRDLAFVVTGFTIGHSITLALAVTGLVRPHAEYIDVLIAVTIALIGAENITVATRQPKWVAVGAGTLLIAMAALKLFGLGSLPALLLFGVGLFSACYLFTSCQLHDAARLRLVVTLVFGLVHGFAFAGDLIEMHLPKGRMVELLFGFNLGVEGGQLTLVTLALGAVWLIRKARLALPRPLVVNVLSASLVALGIFWIVSRTYARV